MTSVPSTRRVAGLVGPGWPAAAVGYLLIAFALIATGVRLVDLLVFTGYAVLCLVLPGTLLWRLLAGDGARPFIADVVFGTCLAYAVELFWYLGVRAAGVPMLVLAWPVLVVGVCLLPRWRSRLWRPREVHRMAAGWSWCMTGVVLFAFVFVARVLWWPSPISAAGLRFPYVDEPYHLSLVAELRHHVPAGSPVVDGEPLYYHWFLHAEVAASSWATGIEPVVLLQRLSLVPMIVLVLMGAAVVAGNLARSSMLGLLAPAAVTLGGAAQLAPSYGDPFLTATLYLSPTTTFAQMLLVPILALGLRLLSADVPAPRRLWVATALVLAAVSAAKATVLPFVMAGFLGVVLLAAVRRRLDRRALALFALCAVTFLLVQRLVFGSQSRGLTWDPLALSKAHAAATGLVESPQDAGLGLAVLLMIVFLMQQLAFAAGIVGLARHGRWRDPRAQFLLGAAAAGTGATFAFAANGLGQAYFFLTTPVVFAVAAVWGLSTLLPDGWPQRAPGVLLVAALAGLGIAGALEALDAAGAVGLRARSTPWGLIEPYVLAAIGVVAIAAGAVLFARRAPHASGMTGAVAVVAVLGLSLPTTTGLAFSVARDPVPPAYQTPPPESAVIGTGGVDAARWLREHSDPDDLVATNRHCRSARAGQGCDNRMFWLSAYAERGILLEGWSYQVRTAPRAEELDLPGCCLPFWDPQRLRTNDAAFRGVPEAVEALRDRFQVRWLVLDRRSPYRLDRLRAMADVRYHGGDYVVLELSPAGDRATRAGRRAGARRTGRRACTGSGAGRGAPRSARRRMRGGRVLRTAAVCGCSDPGPC